MEARMVPRSTVLFLPVLLALSISLSATPVPQSQSLPNAPGAPDPTGSALTAGPETVIRSTVRLVQVSVVVEDKKGNPVTDLKQEDFTLLDDGKPERIAFFTAPLPPAATPDQPIQRASLLPPNAFTNRYDLKGQDPPG